MPACIAVDQKPCGGLTSVTGGQFLAVVCDPFVTGQDVKVSIPGDDKELTLCEVEVYFGENQLDVLFPILMKLFA